MLKRAYWQIKNHVMTIEFEGDVTIDDCEQAIKETKRLSYEHEIDTPIQMFICFMDDSIITDELNHIHVIINCLQNNFDTSKIERIIVAGVVVATSSFRTIIATAMELLQVKCQVFSDCSEAGKQLSI